MMIPDMAHYHRYKASFDRSMDGDCHLGSNMGKFAKKVLSSQKKLGWMRFRVAPSPNKNSPDF